MVLELTKERNSENSEVVPSVSSTLMETEMQTVNLDTESTEPDYLMESKDVIKCKKDDEVTFC